MPVATSTQIFFSLLKSDKRDSINIITPKLTKSSQCKFDYKQNEEKIPSYRFNNYLGHSLLRKQL